MADTASTPTATSVHTSGGVAPLAPIAGLHSLPPGVQLAGPGARLGAALLDGLLCVVTLFIGWFIWSLVTWSKGQSPAKQLLGLRVIKADSGRAATWGQMFVREFLVRNLLIGIVLSIFTLGIVGLVDGFMVFGATRMTLHDKIAGTAVVSDPQKRLEV